MTNYKYEIVFSLKFKKMLKKIQKQNINLEELFAVIDKLANNEVLDVKYKNHKLINDKHYKNCCECHIRPDLLLIYQYNNEKLLLLLINVGSHSLSEDSDKLCYEKKNIMRSWTIKSFFCGLL